MNENQLESSIKKQLIEKDNVKKKQMALEFYHLLINLLKEQALLRYHLIANQKNELLEKNSFERNINHALALLQASNAGLSKEGPSPFTDYVITSALSSIADNLPFESVRHIINELDKFKKCNSMIAESSNGQNDSSAHRHSHDNDADRNANSKSRLSNTSAQFPATNKPSEADKKFNDLMACVSPALITSESSTQNVNLNKQVVIDFAADQLPYREYGIKRARRLGAQLIQARPDRFSADTSKFSISKDTTLTVIGHCQRGSDFLSDNSGNRIYASELAKQIYTKMDLTGAPLNTAFTIDLIACQAASRQGKRSSFAECLVKELSNLGINNVSVAASPTIMLATSDGSQANMSWKADNKATEIMKGRDQHDVNGFFKNLFSTFNSIFTKDCDEQKINVDKVIFRSDSTLVKRV